MAKRTEPCKEGCIVEENLWQGVWVCVCVCVRLGRIEVLGWNGGLSGEEVFFSHSFFESL